MNYNQKWFRSFKKHWKIWLVSLLLALTLIGRVAGSIARTRRSTSTPRPATTITAPDTPRKGQTAP